MEKRSHYSTTDEFYFENENDLVQINFGPNRIQLSNYAAHDLVYRLASYLVFLEHQKTHEAETELPDNVLTYPGRTKNEF